MWVLWLSCRESNRKQVRISFLLFGLVVLWLHFHFMFDSQLSSEDAAWKHKERLLGYDRESAQRTVIIDDQADYYSSSAWLTETEEEEAKEIDQIRYDEKHRRGRTMKLDLG